MARTPSSPARARPHHAWRWAAAAASGVLTYLAASAGLVHYAPLPQIALLTGVAAGLLAPDLLAAAAVSGGAVALGMLLRAPSALAAPWGSLASLGLAAATVAGAAGAGAAARFALGRWKRVAGLALTLGAVALIVANLWASVALADHAPAFGGRSLADLLVTRPAAGVELSDDEFYHTVVIRVAAGQPYYAAFHDAYAANPRWGGPPDSVLGYRLPTLFWFLALLPGGAAGAVGALLVLVSAAVAAVTWLAAQRVRLPLAVPASAALAAYFLYPLTRPSILFIEPWAACVDVVALAVLAAAQGVADSRKRALLASGVALVVLSALLRELMVFLLVAGIVSAVLSTEDRRFRLTAWLAGTGVVAVAYAAHARAALGAGVAGRLGVSPWLNGGLANVLAGVLWNDRYLGADTWFPLVLVTLGLAGAVLARDRGERALFVLACVLPLGAFLFFGNGATSESGIPVNYWGAIVMPLAIALVPWGFAAIPGMSRGGTDVSGGGRR